MLELTIKSIRYQSLSRIMMIAMPFTRCKFSPNETEPFTDPSDCLTCTNLPYTVGLCAGAECKNF
jgi:hypothetical protein